MPKFKFPKDILNACTEYKNYSTAGVAPTLVWRKDLTRKQKREIAALVKDYARYKVFKSSYIDKPSNSPGESYYRFKTLSWSENRLMAEYHVLDIQIEDEHLYLSLDDSFEMVCPENNLLLEHPVSVSKFKKTLSSLVNRIVVKTLGKTASL